MRVVIIGGFIDYQIQLANALCRKGEEVMLVVPAASAVEHVDNVSPGVILYTLERHGNLWYHPANLSVVANLVKHVNSFKPHLIHLQVGGKLDLLIFLFLRRYPLVAMFHDPKLHLGQPHRHWLNFIMYWARKRSNQIFVHGQKLKEIMVREHDVLAKKVHVIPLGEHQVAPFVKYAKGNLKEDGNLVLFFGSIYRYKGLEYLIKAEPLITKEVPNAKIIIAGTGEDFDKYEKMMVNRDSFIVHNHYISYRMGAELFQRCSIVVLPYIDASQSGVVHPAYGFRKPVVTTNVGSIPEIVDDGETGLIVPAKDAKALAEAITRLLKEEKLRTGMGNKAYKKLKTDLSWDPIAERTIDVYNRALGLA